MNKLKENLLVQKCRQGDVEAFRQIYHNYIEKINLFVGYRLGDPEDVEDVLQEVFTDVWDYLSESDKEVDSLQALIYRIAKTKIAKFYQQRNLQKEISPEDKVELEQVEYQVEAKEDVASDLYIKMTIEKVKAVIDRMGHEEYQEILELKYIDQLKNKEIAQVMGKSEGSVRVSLHRAIKRLKKELEMLD
jgi:RNA polymerase sigma-70 factor (ECF subfamily)